MTTDAGALRRASRVFVRLVALIRAGIRSRYFFNSVVEWLFDIAFLLFGKKTGLAEQDQVGLGLLEGTSLAGAQSRLRGGGLGGDDYAVGLVILLSHFIHKRQST